MEKRTSTGNSIDVGSAMGLARHHSGDMRVDPVARPAVDGYPPSAEALSLDAMAGKASQGSSNPLSRQRKGSFAEEAYAMWTAGTTTRGGCATTATATANAHPCAGPSHASHIAAGGVVCVTAVRPPSQARST